MSRVMAVLLVLIAHLVGQFVSPKAAQADPLLTPSREAMLEGWLGQGDLIFTNLYTRAPDDFATAFHAAADGQGPTFSLIEVVYQGNTFVIGGYNPQSWRTTPPSGESDDFWNLTPTDGERTAFIYNLTTGVRQTQRLLSDPDNVGSPFLLGDYGIFQTWNGGSVGPTFGGPGSVHDLVVRFGPVSSFPTGGNGQIHQMTYGVSSPACPFSFGAGGENILGEVTCMTGGNGGLSGVGAKEVYKFVPEPALPAPLMLGAGIIAISGIRRSRGRRRSGASGPPSVPVPKSA